MTLDNSIYGDLSTYVKDILDLIPTEDRTIGKDWYYLFGFIAKYSRDDQEVDDTVIPKMMRKFDEQNHSGGSWGCVMQELMRFMAGQYTDEEKKRIGR